MSTVLPRYTRLSGLEPLVITPELVFVNVGERTNVTGSAQFRKLVKDERYAEAVDVARQQVDNGAQILDVNMDEGLIEGGADVIMVETIFDTLNAKAALYAVEEAFDDRGARLPVMISGTITDASGRTLSGQTAEAFHASLAHSRPLSIGLNCALGAKDLRPLVEALSEVSPFLVSAHPNAGLPDAFGGYDETPEEMAATLKEFATSGLLNLVGGCCGTTPAHIKAIAEAVAGVPPRALPQAREQAA